MGHPVSRDQELLPWDLAEALKVATEQRLAAKSITRSRRQGRCWADAYDSGVCCNALVLRL
jgi:hypothetical protein